MFRTARLALARRVYYGWVIVGACFLASMAIYGTSYSFSVFYDAFIDEFSVSRTQLAAVFGLQTGLLYVVAIGAGYAVDRYGQRVIAGASTLFLTGGLLLAAVARSPLELLLGFGVIAAIGMAGLYVVGYATIPLWFERRRGTAAGVSSAGLGVGIALVPLGADALIVAVGWRTAMLAVAGAAGLLSLAVTLLFVDEPSVVDADPNAEFEYGPPSNGRSSTDTSETEREIRDRVTSGRFALVFVGWTLIFAPLYAVLAHIVVHAASSGIGRSVGVLAIVVIGVTTTGTRLGIGAFSDAFGRTRTFVGCGALLGGAVIGLSIASSRAAFLGVIVLFGVGYGGIGSLIGPQVADLFGNRRLTVLFAVMSLSFGISGLLAPPLAGFAFELTGSYAPAFLLLGCSGIVGAGCVTLGARLPTKA